MQQAEKQESTETYETTATRLAEEPNQPKSTRGRPRKSLVPQQQQITVNNTSRRENNLIETNQEQATTTSCSSSSSSSSNTNTTTMMTHTSTSGSAAPGDCESSLAALAHISKLVSGDGRRSLSSSSDEGDDLELQHNNNNNNHQQQHNQHHRHNQMEEEQISAGQQEAAADAAITRSPASPPALASAGANRRTRLRRTRFRTISQRTGSSRSSDESDDEKQAATTVKHMSPAARRRRPRQTELVKDEPSIGGDTKRVKLEAKQETGGGARNGSEEEDDHNNEDDDDEEQIDVECNDEESLSNNSRQVQQQRRQHRSELVQHQNQAEDETDMEEMIDCETESLVGRDQDDLNDGEEEEDDDNDGGQQQLTSSVFSRPSKKIAQQQQRQHIKSCSTHLGRALDLSSAQSDQQQSGALAAAVAFLQANQLKQQQQQQQQQQLDQLAVARLTAGSGDPSLLESSGLAAATSARLLTASSLTISALAKTDAGLYSCQFKLIPAPSSVGLQQVVASGGQANISMPLFQQQQQARIISGQSGQAIQLTVIEAKLPIVRVSSANGLFVYDRIGAQQTGARTTGNSQQSSGSHNSLPQHQRLEVVVAEPSAELSLKCEHPSQAARATITTANYPELGPARRVLWYLNGAFVHSSANSDLLVLKPPMSADGESANDAASLMRLKLVSGNGGRLSCAHQILDSMAPGGGSTQTLPGSAFHAQSMKLSPSANEVDLRFKVAPMLLPADERRELLMPRYRSFSELELIAQPLNKLKLVCLAQCEPVCSIEWLVNKRPLNNKLELMDSSPMMAGGSNELLDQQLAQVQEIADNQTRIFKSARRLEPSSSGGAIHQSLLMESPLPRAPPAPIQLIQVDNLIHRKTASNLEHFPWYKQTSFVPVPTSVSSSSEMATQVELASRQLMRDSYELANGLAAAAAGAAATAASPSGTSSGVRGPESSFVSNVFSKLELSYNQMSRLLAETNSRWSESEGASQAPGAVMQRPSPVGLRTNEAPQQQQQQQQQLMDTSSELLVECKLDEAFGGRQSQFGYAHVKPGEFYPYLRQKNDDHHHHQQAWTSGVDESAALAGDEQQSDLARTVLNTDQIELRSVLSSSLPAMGSAGWAVGQHEPSTTRTTTTTNRFETRILLERSSQQQPPMMIGTGQSTPVAPSLAELGQQQASKGTTGGGGGPNGHHLYQHQANSNNYPAILAATSNTSSSSSQQTEAQLVKFSSGPHQQLNQQQQQTPAGSSLTPSVRNWLVGHQERILVGASVLALVWLLALFVSPLVQRYLTRSSPKFGFSRAAAAATRHQHHHRENKKTTNWRFNKQHTLSSRTSSTNEIGVTGGAGGGAGSSSSSSSMMAHKFGLQEPPVTFGFGLSSAAAAAAANYYGPPESNGAESSEHDMVQSCSQSSNYEEFTQLHHHQMQQQQQHHTQQRLLHQQPLYFNQAQLIESTTLSRRPLVPSSSSLTASETSAAAAALAGRQRHHHQQQQRQKQPTQQQHYPATMRHNLASVPLISGLNNSGTSSRINFSDLQRHSRAGELGLSRQTTSNGNGSGGGGSVGPGLQLQRHHYSFGKIPLQPAPSGQINGTVQQQQQRPNNNIEHQEHIYDDVS